MKYHFKIHKEKKALWAECIELTGCVTQAESFDELHENMKEALNLYLEEPLDSATADALPDEKLKGKNIIEVSVEPSVALSVLVRHYRKINNLTQEEMMKILKMKNIYSYQRLEKKTDPKLSTLARLKEVFPELSVDYILNT